MHSVSKKALYATQGIEEGLENGTLAGYKMMKTMVSLLKTKEDIPAPSELALKVAASRATKQAIDRANSPPIRACGQLRIDHPQRFLRICGWRYQF